MALNFDMYNITIYHVYIYVAYTNVWIII